MGLLSGRDVTALLSVVADLAVLDDVVPFPPALLRRAGALVGGAYVPYCELDRLRQQSVFQATSDGFASDAPLEAEAREYLRLAHEHPVCIRRVVDDDWTSVRKGTDFCSH